MGRKRQYATDAERQQACRRRRAEETVRVDRAALEHLRGRLDRLQEALGAAAQAGDPLAQACSAASHDTLLERLARGFAARGRAAEGEPTPPAPAGRRQADLPPS